MVTTTVMDGWKRVRNQERLKYAKRRRRALVTKLGGVCADCGSKRRLEIHHVEGRTWDVEKLSPQCRAARYWREYREGIPLAVLCKSCNSKRGDPRREQPEETLEEAPF